MFYTFLLVFVVSCFGRTSSQTHIGDECQLNVWWDSAEVYTVEIPEACLEGDIDWNGPLPDRSAYVAAKRSDVSYSLCLEESWFTVLGAVFELTGGANNSLPLPTEGEQACTRADVDGRTKLEVITSHHHYYMINFHYRIVSL